jgi:hypothetical protein
LFKTLWGLAGCLRGRHERSEAKIRRDGEGHVSRCRYCGVGMRRRAKRDWVVDRNVRRR